MALQEMEWRVVALLFGFGLLLVLIATELPEGTAHEAIRDLGMALLLSCFVGALVEYNLALRRAQYGAEQVAWAVLREILPVPEALRQFRDIVAGSPLVCKNWILNIGIARRKVRTFAEIDKERFVSRGTLSYTLHNPLSTGQRIHLKHELEHEIRGAVDGHPLPRVLSLSIEAFSREGRSIFEKTFSPSEIGAFLKPPFYEFETAEVGVPQGGWLRVEMEREEIVGSQFPWYMVWVTVAPQIIVSDSSSPTESLSFDLITRPTGLSKRTSKTAEDGDKWVVESSLLPGQGFAIQITAAQSRPPAPTSETGVAVGISPAAKLAAP